MNKQELIDYCNAIKENKSQIINCIDVNRIIKKIEQLDEPQKPAIPKFVADWIEYCKNTFLSLVRALMIQEVDFYNYANQKDRSRLIDFLGSMVNQDLFARAWLDGYEVEKEKRYRVKAKGVCFNSCLIFEKINKTWIFSSIYETDHQIGYHTRKELEEAGFGEVFNSPLFEVQEVE